MRGGKRVGAGPPTGNTNASKGDRKRVKTSFALLPDLLAKLEEEGKRRGMSRSRVVEILIEKGL